LTYDEITRLLTQDDHIIARNVSVMNRMNAEFELPSYEFALLRHVYNYLSSLSSNTILVSVEANMLRYANLKELADLIESGKSHEALNFAIDVAQLSNNKNDVKVNSEFERDDTKNNMTDAVENLDAKNPDVNSNNDSSSSSSSKKTIKSFGSKTPHADIKRGALLNLNDLGFSFKCILIPSGGGKSTLTTILNKKFGSSKSKILDIDDYFFKEITDESHPLYMAHAEAIENDKWNEYNDMLYGVTKMNIFKKLKPDSYYVLIHDYSFSKAIGGKVIAAFIPDKNLREKNYETRGLAAEARKLSLKNIEDIQSQSKLYKFDVHEFSSHKEIETLVASLIK